MNGQELLEKNLIVDWAFQEKPLFDGKKKWIDLFDTFRIEFLGGIIT